ncbi:PA2169 family four-helix-bundle protein [Mucilaginibacter ginkgonis]|uniref:PA2169 family four-helix-bundle protein n=1 Tax=Mucilaginibacter ginkgonis TaxID=2682091 RepID=A0A6I4I340_9SPHI|nr:PA2169 family four-helix-bundle protein [Mucilaginibacter ginkgonis]QQL48386.1 PA2169 family four-helix-bundle protein [Mucilaginibacter ginkgonis]
MENTQATIETLNDLIKINNDRIEGYEKATNDLADGDTDLKDLFTSLIGESQQNKMALGTEIQALGADIDNTTSTSGSLHRTWLDIKAAFTGHSTKSVLEECEFGEDAIKKAYAKALEMEHLPAYIRDLLAEQKTAIDAAHDDVKALRDSYENA